MLYRYVYSSLESGNPSKYSFKLSLESSTNNSTYMFSLFIQPNLVNFFKWATFKACRLYLLFLRCSPYSHRYYNPMRVQRGNLEGAEVWEDNCKVESVSSVS